MYFRDVDHFELLSYRLTNLPSASQRKRAFRYAVAYPGLCEQYSPGPRYLTPPGVRTFLSPKCSSAYAEQYFDAVATGCFAAAPPTKPIAPIATTAVTDATRFFKAAPHDLGGLGSAMAIYIPNKEKINYQIEEPMVWFAPV